MVENQNLFSSVELDRAVEMDLIDQIQESTAGMNSKETRSRSTGFSQELLSKPFNTETKGHLFPHTKPSEDNSNRAEVPFPGTLQKVTLQREADVDVYTFDLNSNPRSTNDHPQVLAVSDMNTKSFSGDSGFFSASSNITSGASGRDLSQEFGQLNIEECALSDSFSLPSNTDSSSQLTEQTIDNDLMATIEEIFRQDVDGDTHLHTAIITLRTSLAIMFIDMSPDQSWLDIPNRLLQTPLHLSVLTKQTLITRKLMIGGASLTCQDIKGNTPLHLACMEADVDTINILLQPLSYVDIKLNRYDALYQAVPQDLETKNYSGQTCLHISAEMGLINVTDILLSKGANINSQDGKSGRTILHYAVEAGNESLLMHLLQQRGINLSATTYGDQTAIQLAYGRNMHSFVKTLHEYGAHISDDEM